MTGIDAAAPGDDDRRAILRHRAQPADAVLLACPNCNDPDAIVLIEQATIERRVDSACNVGTTDPEVEAEGYDIADILDAPPPVLVGVRCANCRWGYKGTRPLDRLVTQR